MSKEDASKILRNYATEMWSLLMDHQAVGSAHWNERRRHLLARIEAELPPLEYRSCDSGPYPKIGFGED